MYTVVHRNVPLFFTIIPCFLMNFYSLGMTVDDHFLRSAFDRTGCVQLSQKVVQCLSFQFLSGYSSMYLRAQNLLDSRRF